MTERFLSGRRVAIAVAAGVSLLCAAAVAAVGPVGAATTGRLEAVTDLSVAGGTPVVFSPGASAQPVAPITVTEGQAGVLQAGSTICLVISGATFATSSPSVTSSDSGAQLLTADPQFVAITVNTVSTGAGATIGTGGLTIDAPSTAGPVDVTATLLQTQAPAPPSYGNGPLRLDAAASTSPCLINSGVSGALEIGVVPLGSIVSQTRIFGSDRYDTAATLFLGGPIASFSAAGAARLAATWESASPTCHAIAVLASGDNYPDALAANYLAGRSGLSTQILLTDQGSLPSQTTAALRLAGVSKDRKSVV